MPPPPRARAAPREPTMMETLALLAAAWLAVVPGPTVAVEDTLHTELPLLLVRAPRVTLSEILDRVARGEARRDSLMRDQTFLATLRLVSHAGEENRPGEVYAESVFRVYRRKPNQVRALLLRRYEAHPKPHAKARMDLHFGSGMGEQIVNFAFRPRAHRDFRYAIEGRDLIGNHLVYRIRFTPKTLLDPTAPHGLVWVDTNEFVILRQEVGFDRPIAPPFIQGVDRMVVERERVDGYWVLHRVLMRARAGLLPPKLGRAFDVSLQFDQYAINHGLPDSVFTSRAVAQ